MITAEAINTDVRLCAKFKTSNALFNKINEIWQRSQMDNMHGCIASDCPTRERSAYLGDGQVSCVTVMHNFDAAAFYQKWIRDARDIQNTETGFVPNAAPYQPACGGGIAWGAAMNIMPWEFYLQYGDKKMLQDNYFAMKEQVRYMRTWLTKDGTMFSQRKTLDGHENIWYNLGDWASPYELPSVELVHTFYLWRCADYTARAAKILNKMQEYEYYSKMADEVKKAFNDKFYDKEKKTYGDNGSNVFALVMGVPSERYNDVVNTLRDEIVNKYKGHLNTGIFGTQFLFETLALNGMSDVAYEAMNKRDFPSYGLWIEKGATTTWEQWKCTDSHNHPMFGGGLIWFYRELAGVNADENEAGYKHIIIKPYLTEKLSDVYYSYMTPYGKLVSEVKQHNGTLTMNVTIPVGSYATVYIPVKSGNAVVLESGKMICNSSKNIIKVGEEDGYRMYKVYQGGYSFTVKQ
jgi:alpha-L-rhamnosidase